eukprot:scaffold26452_cov67-Cyclotella_meneghiniana.AAC.1
MNSHHHLEHSSLLTLLTYGREKDSQDSGFKTLDEDVRQKTEDGQKRRPRSQRVNPPNKTPDPTPRWSDGS